MSTHGHGAPGQCLECGASTSQRRKVRCRPCAMRNLYRRPLLERFATHVDASGGPEACWPWTGATVPIRGHGRFDRGPGVSALAHRFALETALGRPLAAGEHALHRCDNPPCVNPAHLWAGSIADNNIDAARKGRWDRKLSMAQVVELRVAARAGTPTVELARRYGLARSYVRDVVRGIKRQHVEMPA